MISCPARAARACGAANAFASKPPAAGVGAQREGTDILPFPWSSFTSVPGPGPAQEKLCAGIPEWVYSLGLLAAKNGNSCAGDSGDKWRMQESYFF